MKSDNVFFLKGIRHIESQQNRNGGFDAYTSSGVRPFEASGSPLPTTFVTSLILSSLHGQAGTDEIRDKSANFLLDNKSIDWSWNYWQRKHPINKTEPYPDDLDDTACALIALGLHDPNVLDGTVMANLSKQLIAAELQVGGPYKTWMASPNQHDKWNDVDVVVNSNVGTLLSMLKVSVPGLTRFLEESVKKRKLESRYYVGIVPALFFLSSLYENRRFALLNDLVKTELNKSHNALMLSMLIIAGRRMGLSESYLRKFQNLLLQMNREGYWPAEAFYVHHSHLNDTQYAGSSALTTSLALKALRLQKQVIVQRKLLVKPYARHDSKLYYLNKHQMPENVLRESYNEILGRLINKDEDGQIVDIASLTASAYDLKISNKMRENLNRGSINGWIAYTIYDNFLDDEGNPGHLSVANFALRNTLSNFHQALPNNKAFTNLVDKTLDIIDGANLWEIANARAVVTKNTIKLGALPDYGDLSRLADRSWGHILASSGVVTSSLPDPQRELRVLHKYFYHYLIARQINDDAHDWEEDLKKGHLSYAVTTLLSDFPSRRRIYINKEMDKLREHFWQHTIMHLTHSIQHHTKRALGALRLTTMKDKRIFINWVQEQAFAAALVLEKREDTMKFIKAYNENNTMA